MKKLFLITIIFIIYLLPSFIFDYNYDYYNAINLPLFSPSPQFFKIVWTILYFLISISVASMIITNPPSARTRSYYYMVIMNYLLNQSFSFVFFNMQDLFFAFAVAVFTFITALYMYSYAYELNVKASTLLIPYVVWTLLASMLALNIFVINT